MTHLIHGSTYFTIELDVPADVLGLPTQDFESRVPRIWLYADVEPQAQACEINRNARSFISGQVWTCYGRGLRWLPCPRKRSPPASLLLKWKHSVNLGSYSVRQYSTLTYKKIAGVDINIPFSFRLSGVDRRRFRSLLPHRRQTRDRSWVQVGISADMTAFLTSHAHSPWYFCFAQIYPICDLLQWPLA